MVYIRSVLLGLITAALVVPSETRAVSPQTSTAVSPYDYKVPVSDARLLRLGGNFSYFGSGSDIRSNDGRISLAYNHYYNSLPFAWDLEFDVAGAIRRTGEDKQEGFYRFIASPGIRRYFRPLGDVFYSGELGIERYENCDRPAITVTPGLGYGRLIYVTPLALAVRIQEFLLEEGLIREPLSEVSAMEQFLDSDAK